MPDPRDRNQDDKLSDVELADVNNDGRVTLADVVIPYRHVGEVVPGPSGANSVQLIIDDMTLPHMGHVNGTVGYDWEFGPQRRPWNQKAANSAMWAMLTRDGARQGTQDAQVDVRNTALYAFNGTTYRLFNSTLYGSQINAENFGDDIYGDAGAGPRFTVPLNRGVQFYMGFTPPPAGTIGFWAHYQARLVSPIDGVLMANVGGDWADLNPFSDKGDWSLSRLKALTTSWQDFNCCTLSDAQIRATPPPL